MASDSKNKNLDRVYRLAKILFEESDKDNKFSVIDIQNRLAKEGMSIDRGTFYSTIDFLKTTGLDIKCHKGKSNLYWIDDRHFKLSEIKLLVDVVASSGTFSNKKTEEFVNKLTHFTSNYQKETIHNNYIYDSSFNRDNDKIWNILSEINKAISQKKQLKFKYFEYDINNKKVVRDSKTSSGKYRHVSPYRLYWRDGNYYVIGWGYRDGAVGPVFYRVDRFLEVPDIVYDPKYVPKKKDFNIKEYIEESFNMMHSKPETVTLFCDNSVTNQIIDKFGLKPKKEYHDPTHFKVTIQVGVNEVFFGWIFGNNGKIKISAPNKVKNKYIKYLQTEIDRYK